MRRLIASVALFLFAVTASAHTVSLSYVNSPDTPNTNVYRLTGSCPAGTTGFIKLTSSPVVTSNYIDSTVVAGNYCYFVTAVLNGVESAPSNTAQATVPVAPPSGLSITSVAINILPNGRQQVLARWSDPSATGQSFFFSDNSKILAQGLTASQTGMFAQQWKGPVGTKIRFNACNSIGQCASQLAM